MAKRDNEMFYRVGKKSISYKVQKLLDKKQMMVDYLKLKTEEQDWHGVADAAMDIREIDSALEVLEGIK